MLYTKDLAEKLKKAVSEVELKQEMDDEFTFEVVATTEDTDRDNEQIKVEWWDTKNWERNPVILVNHSYKVEDIVWKGMNFYTEDGVKKLKGVFSKTNPKAKIIKDLYNEWMLKTVSVGFIPMERSKEDPNVIEKAELLEVSFVAVPANPNAVSLDEKTYQEAKDKGLIKEVEEPKEEVKEEVEVIEDKDDMKEDIKQLKAEISEMKDMIKSLADDKADNEIDEQEADVKAKKEIIQSINKATATALHYYKKL